MNINTQENVFRDLDIISTSETWFPKKYIEDEIKKKVDKTRDELASDEMEYSIRQYTDCLQHNPSWVGRIKNDINKLLVNREYIDFFNKIYEQWSSDNSIKWLPHFKKMEFSQFKVYIEAGKTTQCIVCNNCNMSIFIPSSNVKEGVFCILHMLRIHTGLRKWNKNDRFHIIIKNMNPLGIKQPCLTISGELL